ncbi:hypothetical protein EVG20_g8597 [Dentipellis fragilis]|uniref:Uncharacterized protein n=1 Tax=Dentipellis fragilis TaxID=205917 RepID=A0A4Y9Y5A4_9AGAM|nr:hypothetical protein EVG20_g8597 [Dentipellis fragilis]
MLLRRGRLQVFAQSVALVLARDADCIEEQAARAHGVRLGSAGGTEEEWLAGVRSRAGRIRAGGGSESACFSQKSGSFARRIRAAKWPASNADLPTSSTQSGPRAPSSVPAPLQFAGSATAACLASPLLVVHGEHDPCTSPCPGGACAGRVRRGRAGEAATGLISIAPTQGRDSEGIPTVHCSSEWRKPSLVLHSGDLPRPSRFPTYTLSTSRHPHPPMSAPLTDYVRMSAVDDLSYPLACDDRTRDAVNTIVSGRKSWKTLKGKGEAVWPPYLEAALVEGRLRVCTAPAHPSQPAHHPQPWTSTVQSPPARPAPSAGSQTATASSPTTFSTSRASAGPQSRSAPASSSSATRVAASEVRVPLLPRSACRAHEYPVLKLLSNRDFSSASADDAHDLSSPSLDEGTSDGASAVSDPCLPGALFGSMRPSRALVCIDVLPAHAPWNPADAGTAGGIVLGSMTPPLSSGSGSTSHAASAASAVVFRSPKPRPLRAIDPTVTFTSSTFLAAQSSCSVYYNGNCIGTELTELACAQTGADALFMYSTALVPQYWQRLCESHDPGRYCIVQEIVQGGAGASTQNRPVLLTVVYQLSEPPTAASAASSPSLSIASPTALSNPNPSPFSFDPCDPCLLAELPISPLSENYSDHSPVSASSDHFAAQGAGAMDTPFAMSPLALPADFDPRWAGAYAHDGAHGVSF